MNNKTDMLGRTMFETLAALSVIGLIAAGIAKVAGTAFERYKLSRVGQNAADLQKSINHLYMAKGSYNDLNSDDSWENLKKYVPFEIRNKKHVFGGDIKVGGIVIDGETEQISVGGNKQTIQRRYYVQFDDLPENACATLGDMQWTHDGSSNLVSTSIGKKISVSSNATKTTVSGKNDENTSYSSPLPMSVVDKYCEAGVSILWIFE